MQILVNNKVSIPRKDIPNKIFKKIRRDLTFSNPDYDYHYRSGNVRAMRYVQKNIYGFYINGRTLSFDRSYLSTFRSYIKKSNIPYTVKYMYNLSNDDWLNKDTKIKFKLRPYQKEALIQLTRYNNGVIVMPCGSGKTITLLEVIRLLGQKTLVLVHTKELMKQWKKYIKDMYGKDCGIIQGNTVDIKPITIAMVQTLYRRVLTDKFKDMWGMVILDEAHHSPAESFSKVLNEFSAKYRYGATATIKRSDNLEGLLFSVLGFPRYKIGIDELERLGYVVKPEVHLVETSHTSRRTSNYNNALTALIGDQDRQKLVIDKVLEHRNHHNLVLSNRIEHLESMYDAYKAIDSRCEILIGKVNDKKREEVIKQITSGKIHTVFASTLADEGLDIPILDRLFLTVSTKALGKVEQRIGRIQRVFPDKKDALVFDFIDVFVPMFSRHYRERLHLYRSLNLRIVGGKNEFQANRNQIRLSKNKDNKVRGFKKKVASFVNI